MVNRNAAERTCLDRCLELEQYWLRDKDLSSLRAQMTNLVFQKLHLLSRSAASHFQEPLDDRVKVHIILIRHDFPTGNESIC